MLISPDPKTISQYSEILSPTVGGNQYSALLRGSYLEPIDKTWSTNRWVDGFGGLKDSGT